MNIPLDGFWWLVFTLALLVYLQSLLHREVQFLFLLITRRAEAAILLFSIVFFPGVFFHEASHFLVAHILGVRTGRFSIVPSDLDDGRLQLGFVEIARVDPIREAIIGLAPLLVGGGFVAYGGLVRLGLANLWAGVLLGNTSRLFDMLISLPQQPDFWLWLYLTIAVSSTMMPSASDRRAWLPVGLALGLLFAIALWAGAGGWLVENWGPGLNNALRAVAVVFAVSGVLHLAFLIPVSLLRRAVSTITGLQVAS